MYHPKSENVGLRGEYSELKNSQINVNKLHHQMLKTL